MEIAEQLLAVAGDQGWLAMLLGTFAFIFLVACARSAARIVRVLLWDGLLWLHGVSPADRATLMIEAARRELCLEDQAEEPEGEGKPGD